MIMKTNQLQPWIGSVTEEKYLHFLGELTKLKPDAPLQLLISSQGGTLPIAFSFFDIIATEKRRLTTIGSGQIACAAIIVWLAGTKRLLTPNTFVCFRKIHFDICAVGLENSDTKNRAQFTDRNEKHFTKLAASCTKGKLTSEKIQTFFENEVILEPKEAVELGLAHGITG